MTTTRLYISPLNPSLLDSILPPAARQTTSNTSFHSIETFPEKNYGYVDIATEQAQALKRKWNGSFLKGMKVRVEEARPEKRKRRGEEAPPIGRSDGDGAAASEEPQKKVKRAKREKQDGVLPAVELPTDRQVKRGWVEKDGADKQKKHKKDRDGEGKKEKREKKVDRSQMLFRAKVPPNVASNTEDTEKKDKKKEKKEGKSGKSETVEVKEFGKTTKYPTFLRSNAPTEDSKTSTYVDGKGWVDEDGTIVEAEKPSRKKKAAPATPAKPAQPKTTKPQQKADLGPEDASDSDKSVASTVSSVVSDTSSSEDEDEDENPASPELTAPSSATSTNNVETSLVGPTAEPTPAAIVAAIPPKDVHPLEALFKRPAPAPITPASPTNSTTAAASALARSTPRPAPIVTSFSFFDSDAADANGVGEEHQTVDDATSTSLPQPPVTPFTRRDLEQRGMRSAAPTPDTAAVGKTLRAPWMKMHGAEDDDGVDDSQDDEADEQKSDPADEDEDDSEGDNTFTEAKTVGFIPSTLEAPTGQDGEKEQTDFEKHFWANRGEYNRSWKARKREARKEARQAENRRTGRAR